MVRIRHYLDNRPQDIVLTKSGKNMSVRRLNKLKFIVGCATAALFVSLLFPIGIAAKNSLDSPGDQGTILIIASYNPDTRRMSSFISDFEHKIANENVPFEILIEDLGCKSVAEANLWKDRLISVLERYDRNRLKAVILLGQEVFLWINRSMYL